MRALAMFSAALVPLGLLVVACSSPNTDPAISLVEGPTTVLKGTGATFTCHATDPDGDALTYAWSCSSGEMSPNGSSMVWTAPSTTGQATIHVTAQDEHNATDAVSKDVAVTVLCTLNLVNDTISVPADSFTPYEVEVTSSMYSARLSGSFDVHGNTEKITLYVFNEAGYNSWVGGAQITPLYESPYTWTGTFDVALTQPARYYLVYDNARTMSSRLVSTKADFEFEQ